MVYMMLQIEPRASAMLGKHSVRWDTFASPVLYPCYTFKKSVSPNSSNIHTRVCLALQVTLYKCSNTAETFQTDKG